MASGLFLYNKLFGEELFSGVRTSPRSSYELLKELRRKRVFVSLVSQGCYYGKVRSSEIGYVKVILVWQNMN